MSTCAITPAAGSRPRSSGAWETRSRPCVASVGSIPETPKQPPLPGATYGSFAAACHYVDGTFTPEDDETACAKRSPESGAAFSFWHPDLVTLHLWGWYPNPDGVFNPTNTLVSPFNGR